MNRVALTITLAAALSQEGNERMSAPHAIDLIVCPGSDAHPRNSEGDVLELQDGRLLLAWSEFDGGGEDDAPCRISGKMSADGGRTWDTTFTLQENTGAENVMSVTLRRLRTGEIALFYLEKNGPSDLKAYARMSSDEGDTWGEPICVTPGDGYNVMNNARVIQLSSGRLLAPVSWTSEVWTSESFVSFCFLSDDHGRSWRRSEGQVTAPKRGAMEPGLVELKDGRILMIIRTQMGRIYRSFSGDGGDTWTEAEPTDIVSPEAPATIARIPATGDLLLVWNHNYEAGAGHGGARRPLTAAISRDECVTWEHERNLETDERCTYSYPSITFVGDDVLLTYYENTPKPEHRGFYCSLKFRRLPVSWFYGH